MQDLKMREVVLQAQQRHAADDSMMSGDDLVTGLTTTLQRNLELEKNLLVSLEETTTLQSRLLRMSEENQSLVLQLQTQAELRARNVELSAEVCRRREGVGERNDIHACMHAEGKNTHII